jgi:hypothetical protein
MVATAFIFTLCLLSIFVSKIPWSLNELNNAINKNDNDHVISQPHFYVKGAVLKEDENATKTAKPKVPFHAEGITSSVKGKGITHY